MNMMGRDVSDQNSIYLDAACVARNITFSSLLSCPLYIQGKSNLLISIFIKFNTKRFYIKVRPCFNFLNILYMLSNQACSRNRSLLYTIVTEFYHRYSICLNGFLEYSYTPLKSARTPLNPHQTHTTGYTQ
jgi:hypothetical protein